MVYSNPNILTNDLTLSTSVDRISRLIQKMSHSLCIRFAYTFFTENTIPVNLFSLVEKGKFGLELVVIQSVCHIFRP